MIALWCLAGAAMAVFNAWTRRLAAGRLSPDRAGRSMGWWFAGGFAVRVALTALVLALAFRNGWLSGLLAWLGYYVCRTVLVWRMARQLERD